MKGIRKTKEEYIVEANIVHSDFYDYSLFHYQGSKVKGFIKCPVHDVFEQRADLHLSGGGCPKCGFLKNVKSTTKSLEKFIEESSLVHSSYYSYCETVYVNWKTKVKIKCPKHGIFLQTPHSHIHGRGCGKCVSKISKAENEIFEFVKLTSDVIKSSFSNSVLI